MNAVIVVVIPSAQIVIPDLIQEILMIADFLRGVTAMTAAAAAAIGMAAVKNQNVEDANVKDRNVEDVNVEDRNVEDQSVEGANVKYLSAANLGATNLNGVKNAIGVETSVKIKGISSYCRNFL